MNTEERIKWLEQEVETLSRQVRWIDFLLQRGSHSKRYSKMTEAEKAKWHWCKAKMDLEICRVVAKRGNAVARDAFKDLKKHEQTARTRWEKLKQKARRKSEERR